MSAQADAFPEAQTHPEEEPDERYTPRDLFHGLDREFSFTLDVCATAESTKTPRFFARSHDGLSRPWSGERVWCNPPFSEIAPWIRKAEFEHFRGCELVVMLLPGWTDRTWWHEYVEPYRDGRRPRDCIGRSPRLTTRFLPGRIRFGHPGNPDGVGVGQPAFWCCLLIWERA